ncbi:PilN domain-containing protein, partial [Dyella sedimenti]|uniref:PilN domain-containing protein n=1 Tax=Dyella sedimenti TaxID=2919947 RepID=UPI001FAAC9BD
MLPRSWLAGGAEWRILEWTEGEWCLRRLDAPAPLACWSDALPEEQQRAVIEAALGGVPRDVLRLGLFVPDAWVLRRRMAFPLAARDRLKQVAAYEIDRQTPFRASQVFHEIGAATPLPDGAQVSAELVVVPRARLDPLLARLRELGMTLDAVDIQVNGARLGLNLIPKTDRPRWINRRQRLNLALLAGIVLLLAVSMLQWVHNREAVLEVMRGEVDRMHAEAQAVAALQQRLQDNAGAAGFLAQRKRDGVDTLSILQELSARLPLDASLERLSIDHAGMVSMQGQGIQAASLLDSLKGAKWLVEPAFQGAIQKDPATGKERFYMVAQLRKPAEGKA